MKAGMTRVISYAEQADHQPKIRPKHVNPWQLQDGTVQQLH